MPKKVKKGVPESKSKAKLEKNKKEDTIEDIPDEPDTRKKQVKGKKTLKVRISLRMRRKTMIRSI